MKRFALMFVPLVGLAGCDQFNGKQPLAACAPAGEPTVAAENKGAPPSAAGLGAAGNAQAISSIAEQMAFQLCTARANKWIDDQYYRQEMTALRQGVLSAMGVKIPQVTAVAPPPADKQDQDPLRASPP